MSNHKKAHAYAVGDIINIDLPPGHEWLRGDRNHNRVIIALTYNDDGDPSYILDGYDDEQWGEFLIKQLTNEREKNMAVARYKVGDTVDLKDSAILGGYAADSLKGQTVLRVEWNPNWGKDSYYGYQFSGHPSSSWNEAHIKGLSVPAIVVQDRVKFKYNRETGTVISVVDFGRHAGKALVEWDGGGAPTAEEPHNLVVLYSPTATVEVDEELVAHLNDERQRLLRIIEAATKELRPLTKKWEEAKAGKVVDES